MKSDEGTLRTTPQLRLHVLHRTVTLKINCHKVAKELSIKYNTVRHIMLTYLRTGRVNKIKNQRGKKITKVLGERA